MIWAVPISFLLLSYINHKWGKQIWSMPLQLLAIWSLVIAAYVEVGMDFGSEGWQLWVILLVGIPLTIVQILYQRVKRSR